MLDGWGGSTEPYDDVESDDCNIGWHDDINKDTEEKYRRYQEDKDRHDKKYYMPPFPTY